MKQYSIQYKLTASFMGLQFITLWVVQYLGHDVIYRYIVQESFLALSAISLLVIIFVRFVKHKEAIKKPSAELVVLMIIAIISILSTIFSIDRESSLIGRDRRYEGLYSLICYYAVCGWAMKVKDHKERKMLLHEFLLIGVLSAIVGIFAGLSLLPQRIESWEGVAAEPYGNPNFFGSMMVLEAAVAFGFFLYAETRRERIAGMATLILVFLATFSCDSSSPLVGNIMMFLIVMLAETGVRFKKKNKQQFRIILTRVIIGIMLWIIAAVVINTVRNGSVVKEIEQDEYYADEGLVADKMFSNRMVIWKYALKKLPEYWILGTGPENFWLLTNEDGVPSNLAIHDRVHNEYLHIAICQGIPAVIAYLVFLFLIFISGMRMWFTRQENMPIYISTFLAYFAYIAQAFFNISVIQVAPYFWILCGLCIAGKDDYLDFSIRGTVGSSTSVEINL